MYILLYIGPFIQISKAVYTHSFFRIYFETPSDFHVIICIMYYTSGPLNLTESDLIEKFNEYTQRTIWIMFTHNKIIHKQCLKELLWHVDFSWVLEWNDRGPKKLWGVIRTRRQKQKARGESFVRGRYTIAQLKVCKVSIHRCCPQGTRVVSSWEKEKRVQSL